MDNIKIAKLRKKIKKVVDEKRYEHTLGVCYTAANLASVQENVPDNFVQKAFIAGLLHDCAKCIPADERIKLCIENDIPVSEVEQTNTTLLHAKLGAFFARTKYGINDEDILQAIASHTTGRENMSLLEKIIFVADYIEPLRCEAPSLTKIRKMAFTNLDEAVYVILEDTLTYLKEKAAVTDPQTRKTYMYYKELLHK